MVRHEHRGIKEYGNSLISELQFKFFNFFFFLGGGVTKPKLVFPGAIIFKENGIKER